MRCTRIMGLVVNSRIEEVPAVQNVLTKHGEVIKARIGFHENCEGDTCDVGNKNEGLIILRLCGKKDSIDSLYNELKAIDGVRVNQMDI